MKTTILWSSMACCEWLCAAAQFANLDFDNPNLKAVLASGPSPKASDTVPAWSLLVNGVEQDIVAFEDQALTARGATLWYNSPTKAFEGSGDFHFSIQSGLDYSIGVPVSVSLSQKAVVPPTASSMTFIGWLLPNRSLFTVSLDGQEVPFVELERRQHSSIYGIDVSPWKGQEAELKFTILPQSFGIAVANLDHIEFSPIALVPEPGELALLALGGAAVWPLLHRRRR